MKTFLKLLPIVVIVFSSCEKRNSENLNEAKVESIELKPDKEKQEEIIEKYLTNGARNHFLYSREWQEELDKGLSQDSTIAYLWQQKAMPLFKQGKYEVGMKYIDKAVKYDRQRWQDYRAFIKCIFAKTYREAIIDFQDYKKRYGYNFVMDHSYDFYIGLSFLQLNEFKKAEEIFQKDYEYTLEKKGEDWLHHLDLFYFGMSRYEQKNYAGALEMFNKALKIYPDFSEVQIYKAYSLQKLGNVEEASELFKIGKENGLNGNTINEDNVIYERYPYQMRW